jgi:MFS family permease
MRKLTPLIPLFMSASLLIFGNGLQATLIAWRGTGEGFPTWVIGLVTAAYYLGFAVGCMHVTRMLRAVGHIRAYSAMAAISATMIISAGMFVNPWFWVATRLINGYCLAILFAVIESWINSKVDNTIRARTLSIYRYIDLSSNTAAQYFLPWFGGGGFTLFGFSAIAFALSLTPIALADKSSPSPPDKMNFNLKFLLQISPLAATGCVAVGMTNTVYRSLGPVYARELGFSAVETAWFISAGIISGVVLQYPLGLLSDLRDRRQVIVAAAFGALMASLGLFLFAGSGVIANTIGVFCLGAFSMPLYSLCSAHANDRAGPGQFAVISAGILFFWSAGATIGPGLAALIMGWLGVKALFGFTATVQAIFVLYTVSRMIRRPV